MEDRDVDKVECANHAVKGYRSKVEKLAKDFPAFRGRGSLTKLVIIKITHTTHCAIHVSTLKQMMWCSFNRTWGQVQSITWVIASLVVLSGALK